MTKKTGHPYIPALYTQIDRGTYALQICGQWYLVYIVHLSGSHYQIVICSVNAELGPVESTFTTITEELYTLHIVDQSLEDIEFEFLDIVEDAASFLRSSYGHPGVLVNLIPIYGGRTSIGPNRKQRILNKILH